MAPQAFRRPCNKAGCPALATDGRYCQKHLEELRAKQTAERRVRDARRQRGSSKIYGASWRKIRSAHLMDHPLCVICGEPAQVVDHVIPHKGNPELFRNPDNLQSLCGSCHSRKTARYDGGFGHAIRRR